MVKGGAKAGSARRGRARASSKAAGRSEWLAELRGALSVGALGLAALAMVGFADGTFPPVDALRTLWVHLGIGLVVCGAMLLALKARRGLLAMLAGALFVALPLKAVFLDAHAVASGPSPVLRVLTINVMVTNPMDEAIAEALTRGGYDIVAVQEAPALWDRFAQLDTVYPYREGCGTPQTCDLVLLSRRPLDDVRWTPFEFRRHRLVTATVEVAGQRVGIAAVHLTKPHHDGTQRYETYRLIRALEDLPDDAVLMGDFNAAPWTGLLGWLRGATGFRHVAGYRPTAPSRVGILGVPIDQVMTRGRRRGVADRGAGKLARIESLRCRGGSRLHALSPPQRTATTSISLSAPVSTVKGWLKMRVPSLATAT